DVISIGRIHLVESFLEPRCLREPHVNVEFNPPTQCSAIDVEVGYALAVDANPNAGLFGFIIVFDLNGEVLHLATTNSNVLSGRSEFTADLQIKADFANSGGESRPALVS